MKFQANNLKRILAVSAIGFAMFSGTVVAAHADRLDDLRNAVRHDRDVISRDQDRIARMVDKKDLQMHNRDYSLARKTEKDIRHARIDLRRDQDTLNIDQRALDRYDRGGHDRRWYRDRP